MRLYRRVGWLRDLMHQSGVPGLSLGGLARAAVGSNDWPKDSRMQPRSFAALLSKLDRGQELDWLGDRPGAQVALARALGAPLEDIRGRLTRATPAVDAQSIRLRALPAARALALLEEPLFPGIPAEVLDPGFQRLFWYAPTGSGRTLVGRWLSARGLAQFIAARTWAEARSRLPEVGAVFVELTDPDAEGPPPGLDNANLRVCVASPRRLTEPHDFHVIHNPDLESYLESLVNWVAERTPRDGRFDPERVLEWLRGEPTLRGVIDGPGAVLGLCGLADELGPRALREDFPKLIRRYAHERFANSLDPEAPHSAFFRKSGFGVFVALLRRLLIEGSRDWSAPRSRDEWLALVPEELQRQADLEWLKLSLSSNDDAPHAAFLDRAAKKLPPGAFRVVRSLEQAGLLEAAAGDTLQLGPHFLARAALDEALEALVQGAAEEWGGALLESSACLEVQARVSARARASNGESLATLFETSDPENPSFVAALEFAVEVAGELVLEGREFSSDVREELFDDAVELAVELPGELPMPRVLRGSAKEQRAQQGNWLLGMLALSEDVSRDARRHRLLRPWLETERDARVPLLLDRIAEALAGRPRHVVLPAFALVGRLRAALGALSDLETPHPLERARVIAEEALHGVLTWPSVAHLGEVPFLLEAAQEAAADFSLEWSEVARATWLCWDAAERPAKGADFLAPDEPSSVHFWPHIPRELLRPLLGDARDKPLPFERLGEEPWLALQAAVLDGAIPATRELALHAPPHVLDSWLSRGDHRLFDPSGLSALFERVPDRLLRLLKLHFETPDSADVPLVTALLGALPDSHLTEAVELTRKQDLLRLPEATLAATRKLLHRAVARGGTELRAAYAQLADLESKLSQTRRARRNY